MEIIKVIGYTIFMYFFLIFIIRVMGKREVGSLSIFDLAVYFTISDLITISIVDHKISIIYSIIAVLLLCILQKVISKVTLKNKRIRDFIDGKKSLIINNGVIDFKEMKKQNYSIDDLYCQIREKGIDSVTLIKWAILENSGKLSIITYDNSISNFPDPIISDGIIILENLTKINMEEKTLLQLINKNNIKSIKDIKLCVFIEGKLIFIFDRNNRLK